MSDQFEQHGQGLNSPAKNAVAVTPDDSTDLAVVSRGLYIGVGGDVAVIMAGGQTVTFAGVSGGSILPIRAIRIKATGTTATSILSLY